MVKQIEVKHSLDKAKAQRDIGALLKGRLPGPKGRA